MVCPACNAEIGEGAKFCSECGTALAPRCSSCGAEHAPNQKFCAECGAALAAAPAAQQPREAEPQASAAPIELRLVSVLFVDLVGYTSLSESRDAEDVRELLAEYYDTARAIVARHAGTLEKFIGDAVMAVWGVPVTREDDAERAVRAGLELVDAVTAFGERVGAPDLRARGGIATGQVASVAKEGEGLVVGDRVNTAARTQTAAEPGSVFVDTLTRDLSSAAIAYEDAGEHAVKGKSEPLHLWHALRVVAGIGGAMRERGLEAPLLGRDGELRVLKELFHATLERSSARLAAVSGEAGVGKSRMQWELKKYVDGLAEVVLWHSGRCLSYGDGVAYWALAEMVRARLGISEEASTEDSAAKLAEGLERWIPAAADREFLEPRLGVLVGVADPGLARAELYAGWRLFFERLAEQHPVVLAFEDLQFADAGLLDFIEHLLDWSSSSPIFILTLARPGFAARSEGWPIARRGVTLLELEPLASAVTAELLDALVEGLPARVRAQIIDRAAGVPLYAVETIRALASRGVLEEADGRWVVCGELGELDVPASLSSLLAARLDALEPTERQLIKAMSVFGGAFARGSAVALGDIPEQQLDEVLASLVRKQVLRIRTDPLSPDSGQFAFVQGLLRTVAYEMLSRQERKPRHRAAAEHLRRVFPSDGEDVAEAIASHYLDSFRAARGDSDADELRGETITALRRSAKRTAAIGAPDSAERAYRTAAELTVEESERTELTAAAGDMALQAGHLEGALELFESVAETNRAAGRERDAARVAGQIGRALSRLGRNEEAIARLGPALEALGPERVDGDVAALQAVLGHALLFAGRYEEAEQPLNSALRIARELDLPRVLSGALIDTGLIALQGCRPEEARALLGQALELAERHGLSAELMIARGNSGSLGMQWDLPEAADQYAETLALARRLGDRFQESVAAGNLAYVYLFTGHWDEAERLTQKLLGDLEDRPGGEFLCFPLAIIETYRGELDAAAQTLTQMDAWGRADDDELRAIHTSIAVRVKLASGQPEDALERGRELLAQALGALGTSHDAVRNAWPDTLQAAIELGRREDARALLALLSEQPTGLVPPYLRGQLALGEALLAVAEGEHDVVETEFRSAIDTFDSLAYPYWRARAQCELAGWLVQQGRSPDAQTLLGEANATFTELGAKPARARAEAVEIVPTDANVASRQS